MDFTGINADGLTESELNTITDAIAEIANGPIMILDEGTEEWGRCVSQLAEAGVVVVVNEGFVSNIVKFGEVVCYFLKLNKVIRYSRKHGMTMDLDNVQTQLWVLKQCNPSEATLSIVPNNTVESAATRALNKIFNRKRWYLGAEIDNRYQIETNSYDSFNWNSLIHAMKVSEGFNLSLSRNTLVAGYTEEISKYRTHAIREVIELIR